MLLFNFHPPPPACRSAHSALASRRLGPLHQKVADHWSRGTFSIARFEVVIFVSLKNRFAC